ncbi:MAG: LTA synthase family protein [Bacteroidales bacterium]|nr:LTA synthase family protein [Bacteroidales bacterium]
MTTKREFSPVATLLLRLGCIMVVYTLLRVIFFAFNSSFFPEVTFGCFVYGLRFDLSALAYLNAVYAFLLIIPANFVFSKWYRRAANIVFLIANIGALAFAFIDVAYFPFSLRRATCALFSVAGEANNMTELLPQFLHDFWAVALLFLLFTILLFVIVKYVDYSLKNKFLYNNILSISKIVLSRILVLALFFVGCRGGFQLRPINNVEAGRYTSVENIPVIINTPFSLITTLGKSGLECKDYFSDEEAEQYFTPVKCHLENNLVQIPDFKNIVFIILEGISSEYSDYLATEPKSIAGYTPFLDSLARRSMTFRCYANGQQSIVALPAILGSVPSLSEQPFIHSFYSTNRIMYPSKRIAENGFDCSFYHGGANGTMGFDKFCALAGISNYFGLNEYPNSDDYDGRWGIFDEPYLQYFADELDKKKSPFFACVYTLSSHHPYTIPEKYKEILPKGEFPMQQAVAYTDLALRRFFEKVSQYEWFDKTLFVITSDHTNYAGSKHSHSSQLYNIPLLFFHPLNNNPQHFETLAQQCDIMPSLLCLLNTDEPFIAYGNNLFDTTQTRFAIHYREPLYEMTTPYGNIASDNKEHFSSSPDDFSQKSYYQNFMKAYIQEYNNRMIKNNFNINQ